VQHRMSLLRLEISGDELLTILDPAGLATLKKLMTYHTPNVFLFSAGGNDIVGSELLTFLAPRTEPFDATAALATAALTQRFDDMKAAYQSLIAMRDEVAPACMIVTHGYARAIPTGIKASYLGFSAGPWLKPFLEARGYVDLIEQRAVVDALMQRFNDLLDSLAGPLFVKVDFRTVITDSDWSNEIHPTRNGFEKAAGVLHAELHRLLPTKFP